MVSSVGWKAGDPVLRRYGHATIQAYRRTLHVRLLWLVDNGPWLHLSNLTTTDYGLASFWLYELKKALTDADALLENWRCEILRAESIGSRGTATKVRRTFSGVLDPLKVIPRHSKEFDVALQEELADVVHRVNRVMSAIEEMDEIFPPILNSSLRLREHLRPPPPPDFLGEISPVGRDKDASSVIQMLIGCEDEDLQFVSIVGMGGIGKTTLAQMVYDDDIVQQHFPVRLWVTVSEDFDTTTILQGIVGPSIQGTSLLQLHVREVLCGKQFLLVLDGVSRFNAEKWDRLKISLECCGLGSAVLMTTRSENKSSTSRAYYLGKLADEYVWSIAKQIAFVKEEEGQDLVHIKEAVVTISDGIPLSAAILGGLLRSRLYCELDDWLVSWADACEERSVWRIELHGEWCQSDAQREDIVFLAIELSYKHLPACIKGCFAFCSLFPRTHKIDKDMLIQLWMANDLIPYDDAMDLEAKGSWIFDELVSRCFFQVTKRAQPSQSNRTKWRMHDLVHDTAVLISNVEFTTVLSSVMFGSPHVQSLHHMSIVSCRNKVTCIPLLPAPNLPNLRTLLSLEEQYPLYEWNVDFSKCKSLRVLDLHGFHSSQVMLPSRFLEHLRYLDLSNSWITSIPDDVVYLYNLQTLRLSECCYLKQLPKDLRKMKSLRNLYLDGCFRLENVPLNLGQLKDLHILTTFIVGTDDGCGIGQLKGLNLEGQLEIYNLKNVKRIEDVKGVNLHTKENLRHLTLCWGKFRDGSMLAENANEVLEALQPPKRLQSLKIWRYTGLVFPRWIAKTSSLQNLVKLFLVNCDQCQKLPAIWCLKTLELLCLDQMKCIEYICNYDTVDAEECYDISQAFPKLREMTLLNMQSLKGWQEVGRSEIITLPQLEEMTVINCPMFKMMPATPVLKHFMVEGEPKLCSSYVL